MAGGWNLDGIWAFQTGAHWSPYSSSSPKLKEISSPTTTCTAADVNSGNCQNLGGDFNLNAVKNDRPDSSLGELWQHLAKHLGERLVHGSGRLLAVWGLRHS